MTVSTTAVAWLWLAVAIACEVVGTAALKTASVHPTVISVGAVVLGYLASFVTFALSMRAGMQIGVGYAVWSAVGTAAIVGIGVVFFRESIGPWAVFFLALIVVGVIGLNLTGAHQR